VRVCIVYDCLFPHTIGGAERWYRNLAERLAADGHDVTYLTLRQWDRGTDPSLDGVRVRTAGPRMALYTRGGRRRIFPPLVFGAGVLRHLACHGRRYDVVHTASFPYFSLLAAALARPLGRYAVVVDWHEVWTRAYWHEYLGKLAGDAGWLIQRICLTVPQRAFCFSELHAARLWSSGLRGEVTKLPGEYTGPLEATPASEPEPLVVFAGRHIPEKDPRAVAVAIATARHTLPQLRAAILGDGPERPAVVQLVGELGLRDVVDVPGFVPTATVDDLLGRAMCMLLPSRREGYGMVVIEAASHGTPSIVVAGPDNAAVELVTDGVNGFVADSAQPQTLASEIARVYEAGDALRESTRAWFVEQGPQRTLAASAEVVVAAYSALAR
jgi:glycosyltransferase involved in cell wall biosynthesis